MPWRNSPADRAAQAAAYATPEYRAARDTARARAAGRCEQCHHLHARLQCDHDTPLSQGGSHHPSNLRMLCAGPGTCRCHERKTAQEGGGWRSPSQHAATDPDPAPRTAWQ